MGIEIEAKLRLDDVAALEARLADAGAERGEVVTEVNTYFDTPQGSLRSSDQGLRIRVEQSIGSLQSVATLTHKGPCAHGPLKSRSETQVVVADPHAAIELLSAIGFTATLSFEKRRHHWQLDGCYVDIDTLPYLGHFVEIEGPSEQAVLSVRHALGLDGLPLIRTSYAAMLRDYMAEHPVPADRVRLDADRDGFGAFNSLP